MALLRGARRRRNRDYPRMIYGPHGARKVIQRPEDWIPGWTERPDDGRTAPAISRRVLLPRDEVKRRLRNRGVVFDELASTRALNEVLDGG